MTINKELKYKNVIDSNIVIEYLESVQSEVARQSVGLGLIHKIQFFFMLEDIRNKKNIIYF